MQAVVPNADLIRPRLCRMTASASSTFADSLDRRSDRFGHCLPTGFWSTSRRIRPRKFMAAMSARMLKKIGHEADVPQDILARQFRFAADDAYPPQPLYEVFDPKLWRANYGEGAFYKDKIVVVEPRLKLPATSWPRR